MASYRHAPTFPPRLWLTLITTAIAFPAGIEGTCVSVGIALLVNLVALVLHTLTLNPVNHNLFMQGQIGGTHFNSLVIALIIELLTVLIFVLTIVADIIKKREQ